MPWHIVEGHSECPASESFAVVKNDDGSVAGCHGSRDGAEGQLAALYADESVAARADMSTSQINDLPDSAFAYIEPGGEKDSEGKTVPRSLRHFPVHDAAHVRNALARAPQSPFGDKAMPKIRAAARKFGIEVSDDSDDRHDLPRAPVEFRDAGDVAAVSFAQRIIEMIAVPYEQLATVPYRGEVWRESFERGSFDGIEKRPNRVRANRDHDRTKVVGKAVRFWPSRQEGLVAELRIGKTPLGDETLALADEDMLSASIGFGVRGSDQDLDKQNRVRRIKRAYLDHISFVADPAYDGAQVLAVRREPASSPAPATPLITPNLDEFIADDVLRWTRERSSKK